MMHVHILPGKKVLDDPRTCRICKWLGLIFAVLGLLCMIYGVWMGISLDLAQKKQIDRPHGWYHPYNTLYLPLIKSAAAKKLAPDAAVNRIFMVQRSLIYGGTLACALGMLIIYVGQRNDGRERYRYMDEE